ncbi:MAG: Xaa-Pro aminopeptidase [Psychromonas sp.]|nr:Xaa-Pro aminopeptidase [Psychromonas sp.]
MNEFQCRRARFFEQMNDNSMAVFFAASERLRNNDAEYLFRQNSDFYYLSGFEEPDSCLLLIKTADSQKAILFNRPKDKNAEIWSGYRLGQDAAVSELRFDEAYSIDRLQEHLPALLDGLSTLYFPIFQDERLDKLLNTAVNALRADKRKGKVAPSLFIDSLPILHELRLIKSTDEIALLSAAAEISAAGHIRAMQECHSGMWEYQLQAEVEHEFALQGTRDLAYNSIVAGGKNACILHYTNNNCQLRNGELVLIDAGAEYQGYAGDVTRTFPVNGVFSEPQAKLYQLVLDAQISAISQVKPGVSMFDINKNIIKQLVDGLLELGILQGESEALIENEAYKDFYMHGIGHYLGLDVHDVGDYGTSENPRLLEAGMVVTIEPGLYISSDADVDEIWTKIGIRIEDDVLVTELGSEVLTADVPKSINEIEALMASAN